MRAVSQEDESDGRSVRAQRQRETRREEILHGARKLFAARGYHDVSISDLIESAGIARGTFYLYFDSKRAIFDELLEDFLALLTREVKPVDVAPGAAPPREQLHQIVRHTLSVIVANRDLAAIVLRKAGGLDRDFDRKLNDFSARIREIVGHALTTGQELGIVRPLNTAVVSTCLVGAMKELVYEFLVAQDVGVLMDLDVLTREVLEVSMRGLLSGATPAE